MGAISLPPTLRKKAAKDGAPTLFCHRNAGPPASTERWATRPLADVFPRLLILRQPTACPVVGAPPFYGAPDRLIIWTCFL
jgi:hypothetical protein